VCCVYIYTRQSASMRRVRRVLIKTLPGERDQCSDDGNSDKTIRRKFYCVVRNYSSQCTYGGKIRRRNSMSKQFSQLNLVCVCVFVCVCVRALFIKKTKNILCSSLIFERKTFWKVPCSRSKHARTNTSPLYRVRNGERKKNNNIKTRWEQNAVSEVVDCAKEKRTNPLLLLLSW